MSNMMKQLTSILMMSAMFNEHRFDATGSVHDGKATIKPVPKGMKLFNIDGITVYALNKKNAIRKAKAKQHASTT